MRKLVLAAVTVCIVGALAAGIFWVFVLPALEWSSMVQNLVSHAQTLRLYGIIIDKSETIDKSHPKFQTVLDLISTSRFVGKSDIPLPYATSHELHFYLDNGQWIHLDYYEGTLWWKGIYEASVDTELGNVLDAILLA
ncbi:MAG: hypothetical protein QXV01_08355 [Candidatus Bathyarchaeia archaeon]